MSLPTILSGSLNEILSFNTSIKSFKKYFPDFCVSMEHGAWIYHQVLKDSLKEMLDKS